MAGDMDELLEWSDLMKIFKLSKSELVAMVRDGDFPEPSLRVGRKRTQPRWRRSDIDAFIHASSLKFRKNLPSRREQRSAGASRREQTSRSQPEAP